VTVVPAHLRCAWRGDFGSKHSLAVVNDGAVGALEAAGIAVERLGWNAPLLDEEIVGVASQWPPRFEAPSAGPFVLQQPWEFGHIPADWLDDIRRRIDEVWVPSEFVRRAYVRSGIAPGLVHVVPNGIDTERFTPDGPRWPLPTSKGTVMLFVGGLIFRKGIDILLAAYAEAFSAEDDVCLVVKGFGAGTVYRDMALEQHVDQFRLRPGAPEIVTIDADVPFADLPSLYRAADVLVQPYRGEGFCLPVLEGLACGLPVVVTEGGPTDEFASEDCAWRIPAVERPIGPDMLPDELQPGDGLGFMLEPSVEALVKILRQAADPRARAAKAGFARESAERMTWADTGAIVRERLEALAGRTPIRSIPEAVVPGRRGRLFVAGDDWPLALRAYAEAFAHDADTTLALPFTHERVVAELAAAGIDPATLADVALADTALDHTALELAADAVIDGGTVQPLRARRTVRPEPAALRAVAAS
jgi:glycosyltransferase involved in cell wall biosynthesis